MIALGSRIGGVWRVIVSGKRGTGSTLAKAIESARRSNNETEGRDNGER